MTLKEKYTQKVIPEMKKKFGYTNNLAVPRMIKISLNIGLGHNAKEENFKTLTENTIKEITGQTPVETKARTSVAGFGIREGQIIGKRVTLRGKRMYDFMTKVISAALPRVRDFQGLKSKSIDGSGNLTIGFKEHTIFPEIDQEKVGEVHGLEATFVTNATDRQHAVTLFKLLGFPFKQATNKK